jgi:endonuclease/exonuclease/phosphatase family metal-dependent hydrolase
MHHIALSTALLFLFAACEVSGQPGNGQPQSTNLRIATFNIAMGLDEEGRLGRALAGGEDIRLHQVAEILQRVRPDIVLLNEFDYDPEYDAAQLLNENYLGRNRNGLQAINYPYSFRAPVNTGLDSGLDLDNDGNTGEPEDAFGYGSFPGQFGMLVLSRFPVRPEKSRSFQRFAWASLPKARRPLHPDGSNYYPDETWLQLRLSSKSHWDLVFEVGERELHLLASHPIPPVFDGPEDRNGLRNFDENRFWVEYLRAAADSMFIDDEGKRGGLEPGAAFVIAGDLNADPFDGDSVAGAVSQLLEFPLIDSSCVPKSDGGTEASAIQGGINAEHGGDSAADTTDFNDDNVGNLRIDYLLPSHGLNIRGCGVFWPSLESDQDIHELVKVSDHHLVWLDISL